MIAESIAEVGAAPNASGIRRTRDVRGTSFGKKEVARPTQSLLMVLSLMDQAGYNRPTSLLVPPAAGM